MYNRICQEFNFDKVQDLVSAQKLASIIGDKGITTLTSFRKGFPRKVLICGGGEHLADEISSLTLEGFVVAADSATTVLMESGIDVDMIATDFDGAVEDQFEMNLRGTTVFVHAHGDNQQAIDKYVRKLRGPLIGTCQCPPPPGLVNFGGFTDGDRAACICAELGAKEILLAGFDFERPSNKAGKSKDVKKRKLRWAKTILDSLVEQGVRVRPAPDSSELL